MGRLIGPAVEEVQVVGAFDEGDVGLVNDGGPLEGGSYSFPSVSASSLYIQLVH